jgi:hypothetical protein
MEIIKAESYTKIIEQSLLLKSIHQDLIGFQEMQFLTPDVKTGLGIAIEQVEKYMQNDLEAREQ